jgi:hypothetical protein
MAAALPASLPRPLPWDDVDEPPAPAALPYDEEDVAGGRRSSGGDSSPPSSGTSGLGSDGIGSGLKPLPRNVEGVADDVSLANPLQRMERLGTGWFGTIFELDGVCIEYECGDGGRSWQALAAEEGKPPPPLWALKRARGMKNEQVVTEVLNWTRNPAEARRLAARREGILGELLSGRRPMVSPGVVQLMDILQRNQVGGGLVEWVGSERVGRVAGWLAVGRRAGGLAPRAGTAM